MKNISDLLCEKKCTCGKVHNCNIKYVFIEENAILRIKGITGQYKNIILVADNNTYAVCGEEVKKQIDGRCENVLVFQTDGFLVPNEDAVKKAQDILSDKTDLIIGIGSGVIQDLCKYVSFNAKIPYMIVATAPSMDGYASVGAAMIMNNMKITYSAHVPEAIIGDVNILKDAPMDMIKSGYGDILGKYSCLNDWKLSKAINGEYFCDYIYNLTYEMLLETKDLGKRLLKREKDAVKTLTEALVGVGIAMAYAGNSRPASGSEHHLSHFFELTGIMNNEPYFMHGTDVAFSTVYTEGLREELLKIKKPCKKIYNVNPESEIKRVYGKAADGVIELQNKLGWYKQDKTEIYKEKWNEIKEILNECPKKEELLKYLKSIELDINEFEKLYGKEKIHDAVLYAKDLKDRYSVLWLYNSIGDGEL